MEKTTCPGKTFKDINRKTTNVIVPITSNPLLAPALEVPAVGWGGGGGGRYEPQGKGFEPLRLRDETKTAARETKKHAAHPPIICGSIPPPPGVGLSPGALLSRNFRHIKEIVKCLCKDKSNKKSQTDYLFKFP